jgi:DNA-binding transcriptional MocR family regulator
MSLASRIDRLSPSPVREILSVIDKPGMISFAGGLPAAESFPVIEALDVEPALLQYGASEGEQALRSQVAMDLAERGLDVRPEQVLILSGSQQGIDLVAKLAVETETPVAVESPTYLAALQVFSLFGASYIPYQANSIKHLSHGQSPALIYTIPTFQNPTGYCYTLSERQSLAAVADQQGSILFEDDPYRDLVYSECDRTPVCAFIKHTSWVYQSSFSKTFAPGLRLGYLVCSDDLFPALSWLKQAADLHSNRLSQSLVLSMLKRRDSRLANVVDRYRNRRDAFADCLEQTLGGYCSWSIPDGGLFFWLKAKRAINTQALLQESLKRNVAFMPGEAFFPQTPSPSAPAYLRLNFSHASEPAMHKGLSTLAALIDAAGQPQGLAV